MTERFKEWIAVKIALALPRRLVMWSTVRLMAHATTGQFSTQNVPDLSAMDALKRWDKANENA